MKNSIKWLSFALFLCGSMSFYACGNGTAKKADKASKEYASAYICPMHCEGSGDVKAGNCPTCKMAYVANPDVKQPAAPAATGHEGHDHGSHDGHDHSSHEGHNH